MSSLGFNRLASQIAYFALFFVACGTLQVSAQKSDHHPIPKIVQRDGRYALFVDGAPYLMLGAQTHNSSAWPGMLAKVWPAMEYLNVNTVELPVYWEQFEPRPGQYAWAAKTPAMQIR